jgi:hypothetical protein
MNLKFCGCRHCKYGMHHSKWGEHVVKYTIRKWRHKTKQMLKQGRWYDLPDKVSVPYTD